MSRRTPVKIRRTVRGVYLVGCHRFVAVKWLRPGVRAHQVGLWQRQVGRLLIRLSRMLNST